MYFIQFFGIQSEYAWVRQGCLFSYKGIESFKKYAQDQVDRARSKADKEKLAERFQLKVANNRRKQWEDAIKLADEYIKNAKDTIKSKHLETTAKKPTLKRNTTLSTTTAITNTNCRVSIKDTNNNNSNNHHQLDLKKWIDANNSNEFSSSSFNLENMMHLNQSIYLKSDQNYKRKVNTTTTLFIIFIF